jgi:recombination protein RecR
MEIENKLLREAVDQMSSLPGIGKKTALRLVLNLLKRSPEEVERFSNSFHRVRNEIKYCARCFNLTESTLCHICSNPVRDHQTICVVQDIRDVMAIENTAQYKGSYHILGGIISPIDGIGPGNLNITELIHRVEHDGIKEVILALNSSMEAETTNFYLFKKLSPFEVKVTSIARGIAIGDELEYADEISLGRSILHRTPYENSVVK